jgi:nuclear pore complex protein Nup155
LNEVILRIIHTSNLGVQGRPLVEVAWNEIIKTGMFFQLMKTVISEATDASRPVFDALKDKVREIGLKYYPDDNVFPLSMYSLIYLVELLINKLEYQAFERSLKGAGPEKGWILKTMREIKVPWNSLFVILNDIFETKV